MCQLPVPAESIRKCSDRPLSVTRWRNMPSPSGERQIFPRQTNRTLIMVDILLRLRQVHEAAALTR
ncbi:hypothetical protein D3C72_1926720 [compost metagenome]